MVNNDANKYIYNICTYQKEGTGKIIMEKQIYAIMKNVAVYSNEVMVKLIQIISIVFISSFSQQPNPTSSSQQNLLTIWTSVSDS